MKTKLAVGVLGNRKAGKSTTWYELFGKRVKTGKHKLFFGEGEYVEVFVVSGSPEERNKYVGKIVAPNAPRIVLCAMQYKANVMATVDYFAKQNYFLLVHWLNPGYKDRNPMPDSLGLIQRLLSDESLFGIRNGKSDPSSRVQEIRDFIYGWAKRRDLLKSKK